jgi:hypothetical protein
MLALAAGFSMAGCGGIVREGAPDGGIGASDLGGEGGQTGGEAGHAPAGGRSSGTGSVAGTAARPSTGTGGKTQVNPAACGNGRIEPGEECDGAVILGTCASQTMGARPSGTLTCASNCQVITAQCYSGGSAGSTGSGGFTGRGGNGSSGVTGTGGMTTTIDQCVNTSSVLSSDCQEACGCKLCPEEYAACRADGGCAWILACAEQQGCASVSQCMQTSCSSIINLAGGEMSSGAGHADPALACLAKSGCGVACR